MRSKKVDPKVVEELLARIASLEARLAAAEARLARAESIGTLPTYVPTPFPLMPSIPQSPALPLQPNVIPYQGPIWQYDPNSLPKIVC